MGRQLYELSHPQKSIWLTEQVYKGSNIHNVSGTLIIEDKVNFDALKKAINIFIKQNDAMRLQLDASNDTPMQYISEFSDIDFAINEMDRFRLTQKEAEIVKKPFDLIASDLYRFFIFKFSDGTGGFNATLHHLISDAWSMSLITNRVMDNYCSIIKNDTIDFVASPSYIDCLNKSFKYFNSDRYTNDKEFWEHKLTSLQKPAKLKNVDGSILSTEANRCEFDLSDDTSNKLKDFCKQHNFSLFTLFNAAFSIYVAKITGIKDLVLGSPILNRSNFDEKNSLGLYVSTIPTRISYNSSLSLTDFMSTIANEQFSSFKHHKYPFDLIMSDVKKAQDYKDRLYTYLISYQNATNDSKTSDVPYHTYWIFNNNIVNDLELHIFDVNNTGSFKLAYDFKTSVFSDIEITQLHNRLMNILDQIIYEPTIILKNIEIVTPEEKNTLIYEFNNTSLEYQSSKTIDELFRIQAEKSPNDIALVFGEKSLTYKELDEKSNQLAHHLISLGIEREGIVGIMLNRSLEMIISMFAVLKAGACYLPIDPEYPDTRIQHMLEDSNAQIVLSNDKVQCYANIKKINVDLSNKAIYGGNKLPIPKIASPENLAYIIYTSGSTGKPKGVMLTHKNVNNFIEGIVQYIPFNRKSIIVSVTTICFDIFVLETLLPLTKGSKVVIANEDEQNIPYLLNDLCVKNKVNMIQTTPSRMSALIDDYQNQSYIEHLDYIMIGGEPFPKSLLEKLNHMSKAHLVNLYGPTETTVWSTIKDLTTELDITIGNPISNTSIYLLNEDKNLLPIGYSGELYIGGDGVSRGYYNRPELTSQKFIQNPNNPSEIIYNTGDLAMWLPNGEISHLGRTDFQVKIRGHRIELGEIENYILKFADVTSAVVTSPDNLSLLAYFTAKSRVSIANLKKHLAKVLPTYMIPKYFMQLDVLPTTPNGKIDRKALPSINIKKTEIKTPSTETQKSLLSLLKEELKLNQISIDDNFFEIGGDSLTAIRFVTAIHNKFNVPVTVKNIFDYSTIESLSLFIDKAIRNNVGVSKIPHCKEQTYYPLSAAQKRIYITSNMSDENKITYNMPGAVIFDQPLDANKLQKAFNSLIYRHESLRTSFHNIDGVIYQKINNIKNFNINKIKIVYKNVDAALSDFISDFNLEKAPLMKVGLAKLENGKTILLFDMHHIIGDGLSLTILVDELSKLYSDMDLPVLSTRYRDYVVWENEQLNNGGFDDDEEYWTSELKDNITPLNMPLDFPRPINSTFKGSKLVRKVNADIYNQINDFCTEHNITPYILLLSVYFLLLHKYTRQADILIGSPVMGRYLSELEPIVGVFVNNIVLKNDLNPEISFLDLLKNVKSNFLGAIEHQAYPFDEILNKINYTRQSGRNPIFDTMFIYQNEGKPHLSFGDQTGTYEMYDSKISKFDLSLEVLPNGKSYTFVFEYCIDLFKKSSIEYLSEHYLTLLQSILSTPEATIADVSILSDEEKDIILNKFNDTTTDYPKDKTIHEIFKEQVKNFPDKNAVFFEGTALTYKHLDEKSDKLASYLVKSGIKKDDIVCMLMDKSLEMIVGILGILKAGAAFLPIDVSYPKDRIEYMILDSHSNYLLSTRRELYSIQSPINIINIDLDNPNIYSEENTTIENVNTPLDLAYIMYTSGSTGEPKGSMVTHQNVVRLVKNTNYIDFVENEKILQTGSIVFDACTFEIWGALLNGYELHLLKKSVLLDVSKLKIYIQNYGITTLWLTAPLFNQLSEEDPAMFITVKNLLTGGDVLSPKHINAVMSACPNLRIINGYGPTENTTFSTCFTIDKQYINNIPIGYPISNSTAYIINKDNKLQGVGIPGELWVGGDGVSRGYLNKPDITASKFTDNPFTKTGKIYMTGDLARWLPDGKIEFLGRIDTQVKIRGYRIELSEISSQILEFSNVKECAVIDITQNNEKFLCAYISSDKNINFADLRMYLSKHLPSYMIPRHFIQLDKLPLNTNGKIDRSQIPTNFSNANEHSITKPSNDIEALLLDIWKTLLDHNDIELDQNFFEIGGDSLLAMKMQLELLRRDINVSYASIFKHSTIKSLAEHIKKKEVEMPTVIDPKIYTSYNTILSKNDMTNYKKGKSVTGNLLLTGFTGFLGAHVLDSFLKMEKGSIYCLIRNKNGASAMRRLINTLHFYFGDKYDNLLNKRIFLVKGDIALPKLGLTDAEYEILGITVSTIVHSAALVKHFGRYADFKRINIDGTKTVVAFAQKFHVRLMHISTISVSGNALAEQSNVTHSFTEDRDFTEKDYYIEQSVDNPYVRSKFESERVVLEAIKQGLEAYILRMGNLTSRYSEGTFQHNHFENAFVNRFKSILEIGYAPDYMLDGYVEFTPIDYCADAIIKLARHYNNKFSVFHLLNEKHVQMDRLFDTLISLGINIKLVNHEEFVKILDSIIKDDSKKMMVSGILSDLNTDKKLEYTSNIKIKSDFTKEILEKAHFKWPFIGKRYIKKYLSYLTKIGYFDINLK